MSPLQAPSAALDNWLAGGSNAGSATPVAATVDNSIQAVHRCVQTCTAELQCMHAASDAVEAVRPPWLPGNVHCHLHHVISTPTLPLVSAALRRLNPSSTPQAVLYGTDEAGGEDEPSEQHMRASLLLIRPDCDAEGSQDIPLLQTGRKAPTELDSSPAAAAQDSLLRMVTVLDALEAEQKLMVSAALKFLLQEPTPLSAEEAARCLSQVLPRILPTK